MPTKILYSQFSASILKSFDIVLLIRLSLQLCLWIGMITIRLYIT